MLGADFADPLLAHATEHYGGLEQPQKRKREEPEHPTLAIVNTAKTTEKLPASCSGSTQVSGTRLDDEVSSYNAPKHLDGPNLADAIFASAAAHDSRPVPKNAVYSVELQHKREERLALAAWEGQQRAAATWAAVNHPNPLAQLSGSCAGATHMPGMWLADQMTVNNGPQYTVGPIFVDGRHFPVEAAHTSQDQHVYSFGQSSSGMPWYHPGF